MSIAVPMLLTGAVIASAVYLGSKAPHAAPVPSPTPPAPPGPRPAPRPAPAPAPAPPAPEAPPEPPPEPLPHEEQQALTAGYPRTGALVLSSAGSAGSIVSSPFGFASLFSTPGGPSIGQLPNGTVVYVVQSWGGWCRLASGAWVACSDLASALGYAGPFFQGRSRIRFRAPVHVRPEHRLPAHVGPGAPQHPRPTPTSPNVPMAQRPPSMGIPPPPSPARPSAAPFRGARSAPRGL
jgi:hypothetical protein